jgi:ankyrin repeat protein
MQIQKKYKNKSILNSLVRNHDNSEQNLSIIKRLIDEGSDVNFEEVRTNTNDTPLSEAVNIGSIEIIKLLIERNINYNITYELINSGINRNNTILHVACNANRIRESANNQIDEMIKLLISKVDVNAKNSDGDTALMSYIKLTTKPDYIIPVSTNFDIIKLFLDNKVNVKEKDKEGNNILMIYIKACSNEFYEPNFSIIKLFISNGINIDEMNYKSLSIKSESFYSDYTRYIHMKKYFKSIEEQLKIEVNLEKERLEEGKEEKMLRSLSQEAKEEYLKKN